MRSPFVGSTCISNLILFKRHKIDHIFIMTIGSNIIRYVIKFMINVSPLKLNNQVFTNIHLNVNGCDHIYVIDNDKPDL